MRRNSLIAVAACALLGTAVSALAGGDKPVTVGTSRFYYHQPPPPPSHIDPSGPFLKPGPDPLLNSRPPPVHPDRWQQQHYPQPYYQPYYQPYRQPYPYQDHSWREREWRQQQWNAERAQRQREWDAERAQRQREWEARRQERLQRDWGRGDQHGQDWRTRGPRDRVPPQFGPQPRPHWGYSNRRR